MPSHELTIDLSHDFLAGGQGHNRWHPDIEPALTIADGDTVVFHARSWNWSAGSTNSVTVGRQRLTGALNLKAESGISATASGVGVDPDWTAGTNVTLNNTSGLNLANKIVTGSGYTTALTTGGSGDTVLSNAANNLSTVNVSSRDINVTGTWNTVMAGASQSD